ncbi:MAG: hypothetical protein RIS29_1730 [Bacteroidota bacterium]
MTQTFRLRKGQISFVEDRIFIEDDAKRKKYMSLLSTGFYFIWGFSNMNKFARANEEFFFMLWFIFVILSLILFISTLFRATNGLIYYDNVKSMKVKRRFKNTLLDIKLDNHKYRRVIIMEDAEELKDFIEKYQKEWTY